MSAKEILQNLKSNIESLSQITEDYTKVGSIRGNPVKSAVRIAVNVEGKIKIFEVTSTLVEEYIEAFG
jgi:hypothetical protein